MNEKKAEIIPWNMTLEQCHDSILHCLTQGIVGHYRIGLLYNHIVERRLAVNRGHRTTRAYFRHHVRVLSHKSLTMYGAVARSFELPVCEKYGMANLGALLDYLRLANVWLYEIDTKEPGPTPIELPRRGGLTLTKPFSDCTMEDLKDAVWARRAWPGHGKLEPEEAQVERYLETIKRHFKDNSHFPPKIDAQVNNRRIHLRIRHLRVWELPRLVEALWPTLKSSPPAPAVAPAPASPEAQPVAGVVSSLK